MSLCLSAVMWEWLDLELSIPSPRCGWTCHDAEQWPRTVLSPFSSGEPWWHQEPSEKWEAVSDSAMPRVGIAELPSQFPAAGLGAVQRPQASLWRQAMVWGVCNCVKLTPQRSGSCQCSVSRSLCQTVQEVPAVVQGSSGALCLLQQLSAHKKLIQQSGWVFAKGNIGPVKQTRPSMCNPAPAQNQSLPVSLPLKM